MQWLKKLMLSRPFLELPAPTNGGGNQPLTYEFNTDIRIEHNAITQNGGMDGAGGGVSLMTGSDNYRVRSNFVCGNFTQGDGAGIGHLGLSNGGRIDGNTIAFNQSFLQQTPVSGGGVFIGGEPGAVVGEVSYGAGNVRIDHNLIQGNEAASGHGGGIRTQNVNGFDVANSSNSNRWYQVRIDSNTIVNNVAGESGGGISLHNTARGLIQNNVVAHNDSTATTAGSFPNGAAQPSVNQPAGVSSEPHSQALLDVLPASAAPFSNPTFGGDFNYIVENRSFHYEVVDVNGTATAMLLPDLSQNNVGECVSGANISNLGVTGDNAYVLGPGNATYTDPGFADAICNGGRSLLNPPGPMYAVPALDEGGATWIQVRFGPLQLRGDYTY